MRRSTQIIWRRWSTLRMSSMRQWGSISDLVRSQEVTVMGCCLFFNAIFSSSGIQRTCTRDYKIPDSEFTIPKDLLCTILPRWNLIQTTIWTKNAYLFINLHGNYLMLREEDCFPNPDKFDPDNFNESEGLNKFGFMGFGQGPRNCIGRLLSKQNKS